MKDEVWVRPFCPQWEKIILKLHILFDSCRDSWSYVQACSQGPREAARDKQLLTLAKASPHFLLADQNGSKPLSGASFQMWNQFVFLSFITNILPLFGGIPGNGTFLFCYILICLAHVARLSGPTNHWLSSQSMVCVQPISQTNTSFLVAVPDVGKSDLQSQ